jgi:nicotinamidase-related amidase
MPKRKRKKDLHGSAPDSHDTALLLIDVINHLDFKGNDQIVSAAEEMALRLRELKLRAKAAGVPVIYVNDNFGRWQSDFRKVVRYCTQEKMPGRKISEMMTPEEDDYFVLKPKHSGFYSSTLEILLEHLEAKRLILTGVAGNICVLFTANDAYMRDYELFVPRDCCVSNSEAENNYALQQMERVMKADTRPSREIRLTRKKPDSKKAA